MWNDINNTPREIEIYENILNKSGYGWEKYEITTEDGYINSMYRMNMSRNTETHNNCKRPPVILVHGMNCCSGVFLNQSRLAYYLVDEGFDVWLPNCRGTTLSRRHVKFDHDRDNYWNFSWHEIGMYDLPAFVNFIVEKTGFQKIHYIGHSQGTSVFAVCASERPEFNEKFAVSCLMGCTIATELDRSFFVLLLMYIFCPLLQLNIQDFIRTEPNSFSVRQLYHYLQQLKNRRFAKYDYGVNINKKMYGSVEPPEYDLEKVTAPVALFYGKNDMYNNFKKDKLDIKMGNVVHVHVVESELFNHIDFAIAKDSISLLYKHMVKIMRKYEAK